MPCLPARIGKSAFGDFPTPGRLPVFEKSPGLARARANVQQGLPLEQRLGGEYACHRKNDDDEERTERLSQWTEAAHPPVERGYQCPTGSWHRHTCIMHLWMNRHRVYDF